MVLRLPDCLLLGDRRERLRRPEVAVVRSDVVTTPSVRATARIVVCVGPAWLRPLKMDV